MQQRVYVSSQPAMFPSNRSTPLMESTNLELWGNRCHGLPRLVEDLVYLDADRTRVVRDSPALDHFCQLRQRHKEFLCDSGVVRDAKRTNRGYSRTRSGKIQPVINGGQQQVHTCTAGSEQASLTHGAG